MPNGWFRYVDPDMQMLQPPGRSHSSAQTYTVLPNQVQQRQQHYCCVLGSTDVVQSSSGNCTANYVRVSALLVSVKHTSMSFYFPSVGLNRQLGPSLHLLVQALDYLS